MLKPTNSQFTQISSNGHLYNIEYKWVDSTNSQAPLLLFLHEGLGSLSHWGEWPELLATKLRY